MEPSTNSSYAHVFLEQPRIPWLKLGSNKLLSLFHAQYWGQDISQERRIWLDTPKAHQMDTDEDQIDNDENQMKTGETPAGFPLHFDIQGLTPSTLWVREDYESLYDWCMYYFNRPNVNSGSKPPSVIITGQPGIGKSHWVFYATRRRLGAKEPFVWYYGQTWYLFVEDGVFECPSGQFSSIPFHPQLGLWALVDADIDTDGIPPEVAMAQGSLHIIFTTSPQLHRWKVLTKTTQWAVVIMNPWSWVEMRQAAVVCGLTAEEIKKARRVFNQLGPTARFCIDFVTDPRMLESYESQRQDALQALKIDDLIQGVRDSRVLRFKVSHTLFLIRRVKLNPWEKGYLHRYIVEPITPHVRHQLKLKLMEAKWEERLRVYETFEPVQGSKRLAGLVFETIGQRQFQKKVALTLVPMLRKEPTTKRRSAQWESQFARDLVSQSTEGEGSVREMAKKELPSIEIQPRKTIQYPKPRPQVVNPSTYYVPASSDQVGFDSFIVANGALYMFQFTIADDHPIKTGLVDFFSESHYEENDWHFIFVVPPGGKLTCSESSDEKMKRFWNKVKMFTAEIDPKEQE